MANREDLAIIRAARAGDAKAQLALGKRYLTGGNGLPQSLPTAMHWLERAARADQSEAWSLIGAHIPFELATQAPDIVSFSTWYERAFDEGLVAAGLVFSKLVLTHGVLQQVPGLRGKAIRMLEVVAKSGAPEAQWLLAQHAGGNDAKPSAADAPGSAAAVGSDVAGLGGAQGPSVRPMPESRRLSIPWPTPPGINRIGMLICAGRCRWRARCARNMRRMSRN
jgi:hypothetical protein